MTGSQTAMVTAKIPTPIATVSTKKARILIETHIRIRARKFHFIFVGESSDKRLSWQVMFMRDRKIKQKRGASAGLRLYWQLNWGTIYFKFL